MPHRYSTSECQSKSVPETLYLQGRIRGIYDDLIATRGCTPCRFSSQKQVGLLDILKKIAPISKIVRARPEGLRAKAYFRHLTSSQIGLALKH